MMLVRRQACLLALGGMLSFALPGCSDSTGESSEDEERADDSPMFLVGAFHSSTGLSEPSEFNNGNATPEEIATGTANLQENEKSANTKTIFVAVEVSADEKENRNVGAANAFSTGELHSAATLTVDDTNEYADCYDLNDTYKVYAATLRDLGYYNGTHTTTLYGGSDDTARAIFAFLIGNNDFESGTDAHLEWGTFSLDFPLSEIVEVESPNDIVEQLSSR